MKANRNKRMSGPPAENGDIEALQQLVKDGADLNTSTC